MKVVFIEWNGEITAGCVGDNVGRGLANMVWQADAQRGEVIAEMSQRVNELTTSQEEFYQEIFELGRRYERERIRERTNEAEDILD